MANLKRFSGLDRMNPTAVDNLLKELRITMTAEYVGNDIEKSETGSYWQYDEWKIVFKGHGCQMTVPSFKMGIGHNGNDPTAYDVLCSLVMDACSIEDSRGFEDWASNLGYDPDSRKAEKIYQQCEQEARKFNHFVDCIVEKADVLKSELWLILNMIS